MNSQPTDNTPMTLDRYNNMNEQEQKKMVKIANTR